MGPKNGPQPTLSRSEMSLRALMTLKVLTAACALSSTDTPEGAPASCTHVTPCETYRSPKKDDGEKQSHSTARFIGAGKTKMLALA
jgi:hypothetical protein